jgi:tRNA-2-methylthio-N6-dimethylallyladenosine synthase
LVEEINQENKLVGRTRTNKLVYAEGSPECLGKLVNVKIEKVNRFSLEGSIIGGD